TEVGLTMYLDMLDRAVKAMKDGRTVDLDAPLAAQAEVEMRVPALLPETYVSDVNVRLALYKKIAAAADNAALDTLTAELVDRFGELPPQTLNLLRNARLRLITQRLGIRRLDFGGHGGTVLFETENRIDPLAVIRLIQDRSREYRLEGPLKLRISRDLDAEAERYEFVSGLLQKLAAAA
ncbi:MAG: TRCF domain-containing protein, partial [Gammaproteobacteria bacterium]